MPHEAAAQRIASLPLVSREVMEGLLPELRAYAFTITGLDVGDQMARVRDMLKAVPLGDKTWDKARKEIAAELDDALGGKVAQRRAELLLRTHVFRGYAAARYRNLIAQVDVFPFWQYKTHGDGNVRPSHAALNGKIFPAGHEIWQKIFPPWDWGCRCLIVPLTERAAGLVMERGKPSASDAKEAHLLPTQIAKPEMFTAREAELIAKNGRLPNGIPLNRTPTWADSPWSEPGNVKHDWRLIRKRYADQPEVLKAFENWAKDTEIPELDMTVDEWIGAEGSDTRRMVRAYKKRIFAPLDAELKKRGKPKASFSFVRAGRDEKSLHERAMENKALRDTRPDRKAPASDHVEVLIGDAHGEAMTKAKLLMDHAHDDGSMDLVTMDDHVVGPSKDKRRPLGSYLSKGRAMNARIGVLRDGGAPILTSLHELGHHVAAHLDPEAITAVARVVKIGKSAEYIKTRALDPGYWLDEQEIFGRAYAQFVASQVTDTELHAEIRTVLEGGTWFEQFTDEDWPKIENEVKMVLRKKGWLK